MKPVSNLPVKAQASRQQNMASRLLGNILSPSGGRARLAVFCYHQVLAVKDELRPDEPSADEFRSDMESIARFFNVLPLPEAVSRLEERTLPRLAACITFDDGYANNHEIAAPILEYAGLPATFFVAGGAVDEGIMWNDLVIEAVSAGPKHSGDEQARKRIIDKGISDLKYMLPDERWTAANKLYRMNAGSSPPRLMMTRRMVRDLADRGFDIGGHTINHPILRELPDDDARKEIQECRYWVETVTGAAPTTFAYPNGKPQKDFDARHESMVSEAGFKAAFSTDWRICPSSASLLSIPRIGPWWRSSRAFLPGLLRSYVKSYL